MDLSLDLELATPGAELVTWESAASFITIGNVQKPYLLEPSCEDPRAS